MVLVVIGLIFIFIGVLYFGAFVLRVLKGLYYLIFDIDKGYENEVIKQSKQYKDFADNDIFKKGI